MSDEMWFQRVVNARDGFPGFWMCPTPNCDGAGFCFDIFPTDPAHPANDGWTDDDGGVEIDGENDSSDDVPEFIADSPDADATEWDPDETRYKELDAEFGDEDDDLEGEEWKFGLEPGERPPEPEWAAKARREWEEEQKKYDLPDERPRELDWSDKEDCTPRTAGGDFTEDDIPF
jgi:hypothetical protein